MVENPLAFEFSKTRTICDAFDEAWAFLQRFGIDLTEPSNSLATQTILAKRIIETADQGLRDIPELGEAMGAQAAPLAELNRAGSVGETPQPAATGAHSTAGMGQSRLGATSNSNLLAALHSGLEPAHEVRGRP
jgi:hypothetical protein